MKVKLNPKNNTFFFFLESVVAGLYGEFLERTISVNILAFYFGNQTDQWTRYHLTRKFVLRYSSKFKCVQKLKGKFFKISEGLQSKRVTGNFG